MPPPSLGPKSIPRGASMSGSMMMRRPSAVSLMDDPNSAAAGSAGTGSGVDSTAAVAAAPRPVSPDRMNGGEEAPRGRSTQSTSDSETRASNTVTETQSSSLPSTHNPHTKGSQAPAAIPQSHGGSSDTPSAPGSGVFVKRKVKKGGSQSSTGGDAPLPSDRRNRSPGRYESDNTPRQSGFLPRSILRNPTARHSTITFSADLVGITMEQIERVPLIKKADVEQQTLRDEVFSTLNGPVVSKEQITMNIASDDSVGPNGVSQGIRIEGVIDHLRNSEEQNAVIRRLADFLHSANVFTRSLAPFYALDRAYMGDKTALEAAQRILVREVRINDVPIKSVAPSDKPNHSPTAQSATRSGPMTTPVWDPDYKSPDTEMDSQSLTKYEQRRLGYQTSIGIMNPRSQVQIPTPHHGRWERSAPTLDMSITPEARSASMDGGEGTGPSPQFVPVYNSTQYKAGSVGGGIGGLNETPRDTRRPLSTPYAGGDAPYDMNSSQQQYPPRTLQATYYGMPQQSAAAPATRLLYRDSGAPQPAYNNGFGTPTQAQQQQQQQPGATVYRTRQYVVDDPGRIRGTF